MCSPRLVTAISLLLASMHGVSQSLTKEQVASELEMYVAAYGTAVGHLESCAAAFPDKRKHIQAVRGKIKSVDVEFFKTLERRKDFSDTVKHFSKVTSKTSASDCERLLGSNFEELAATGARLSESIKRVKSPGEEELITFLENYAATAAEIELCVQRFPEKVKRTAESYRRFKKENLEAIKLIEARPEYRDALGEIKEQLSRSMSTPELASHCQILPEMAERDLANHAQTIRTLRALNNGAKK